ncbi:MAG: amidohydrolase family protein, partial [Acidobacteria bacterium]|nr:amidohydrolase family protein [Acidobacteriota bacterium]
DGLIVELGKNITIPPDYEILEGENLWVYPGLIDSLNSQYLMIDKEKKKEHGKSEPGDKKKASQELLKTAGLFKMKSGDINKNLQSGITVINLLPEKEMITGLSSIVTVVEAEEPGKALIKADYWLGVAFQVDSVNAYPNQLLGAVAYIRQLISDVQYYKMHKQRWERSKAGIPRPEYNQYFEELVPFAIGKEKILFLCKNKNDILRAIKMGKEHKLNYVIADLGSEAFKVIPEIKKAGVDIILTPHIDIPKTSIYAQQGSYVKEKAEKEIYPKNAALLEKAGIKFAIGSIGSGDPGKFTKELDVLFNSGLSKEKALRAMTTDAASILGLKTALGSIEKGKIADLIITEGKLWEKDSKIKYAFIDGIKNELKAPARDSKPGVNATGSWSGTISGIIGEMPVKFDLVQEGGEITGTLSAEGGSWDITNGSVSGNSITFDAAVSLASRDIVVSVSVTIEGDEMKGSLTLGRMGEMELKASRTPGEV